MEKRRYFIALCILMLFSLSCVCSQMPGFGVLASRPTALAQETLSSERGDAIASAEPSLSTATPTPVVEPTPTASETPPLANPASFNWLVSGCHGGYARGTTAMGSTNTDGNLPLYVLNLMDSRTADALLLMLPDDLNGEEYYHDLYSSLAPQPPAAVLTLEGEAFDATSGIIYLYPQTFPGTISGLAEFNAVSMLDEACDIYVVLTFENLPYQQEAD